MSNRTVLLAQTRASRYPFSANIEIVNIESESAIKERTCDLSVFGCFVKSANPWAVGTRVRLTIMYKGSVFTTTGDIAHVQENGMGVKFSNIAPKDEVVLEIWMAELRNESS